MQQSKSWHEDDIFWETWGPVMFNEKRLENAVVEVEKLVSLLEIKQEAHILDLGCGVGRHSLELARYGFQVTGVDRTRSYLDIASGQAKEEGLNIEFVQDDMRTFNRTNAFDIAINMFTSFSYFEDPEEDKKVVANVYRSLRSGGAFILETMGKEILARIFKERDWYEENGVLILEERKISKNWSWMENRWVMIKDGNRTESKISHRLYSAVELSLLFTECGFTQIDIYGDLSGSAYDNTAERLIIVGCK